MQDLHIYRTPKGNRILFRESEIAEPPKYFANRRSIELTTVYGSTFRVMSIAPETLITDEERDAEPGYYVFHWSPPNAG